MELIKETPLTVIAEIEKNQANQFGYNLLNALKESLTAPYSQDGHTIVKNGNRVIWINVFNVVKVFTPEVNIIVDAQGETFEGHVRVSILTRDQIAKIMESVNKK